MADFEDQMERTRKELGEIDDKIKRHTGLTGSELSERQQQRGGRHFQKRPFEGNNRDGQARVFSRLGEAGDRRRKPQQQQQQQQDPVDEADKHTVASTVQQQPRERKQSFEEKPEMKSRNRRMLGVLMGALADCEKQAQPNTSTKRFMEIDSRLQEQNKKERQEAFKARNEMMETRKQKLHELEELEAKQEHQEQQAICDSYAEQQSNFIRTKAQPAIFYLPAKPSDRTNELLATSRDAVLAERHAEKEKSTKQFEIELARISTGTTGENSNSNNNNNDESAGVDKTGAGAGAGAGAGVDGVGEENNNTTTKDDAPAAVVDDIDDEDNEVIQAE